MAGSPALRAAPPDQIYIFPGWLGSRDPIRVSDRAASAARERAERRLSFVPFPIPGAVAQDAVQAGIRALLPQPVQNALRERVEPPARGHVGVVKQHFPPQREAAARFG